MKKLKVFIGKLKDIVISKKYMFLKHFYLKYMNEFEIYQKVERWHWKINNFSQAKKVDHLLKFLEKTYEQISIYR